MSWFENWEYDLVELGFATRDANGKVSITEEDEAELVRIANEEIDMSETYLGRYALMQKKNALAAVLDFTDEEWESLKKLKEDDMMRGTANGGEINEEAV